MRRRLDLIRPQPGIPTNMRFSSLFVLSSIIVSSFALPVINFVPALNEAREKFDSLTAQINAFPLKGGTFDEAIKIHGSFVLFRVSLGQYIKDLYYYPVFTEADSRANMKAAKKLERSSEVSLNAIVAKKDAFRNVPGNHDVLAIFIHDAETSASFSESFNDALVAHTHPSYVSEAQALRDKLAKKFKSTIAALKSE